MTYFAGIDLGSTTTELVLLNENAEIVNHWRELTSGDVQKSIQKVLGFSSQVCGVECDQYDNIVATGYGRKYVKCARKTITEITCYAKGAHFLDPQVRTIIDIGGQDSKVISLDENGAVSKFLMNDKCAAGTGRFLEMVSRIFNVDIEDLGELSLQSKENIKISNVCTVFAESEIVSLFSKGVPKEDIIASAQRSICERVYGMLKRVQAIEKVMFCGGVAKNIGICKSFETLLGCEVIRPQDVFMIGALGAALIAKEAA
jgi:predicted CoA-substrate-specific enzyme activase